MSEEPPKSGSFEIMGPAEPECLAAADLAYQLLDAKLSAQQMELLRQFKIRFFKSDKEHGSHVDFERQEIASNRDDMSMSMQAAEDHLVEQGVYDPGDITKLLPDVKDRSWSVLTSEIIHESGHILDMLSGGDAYRRLDTKFSPTKYGNNPEKPWEAFAEAFRFYILDGKLSPEAKKAVEDMLGADEVYG